MQSPAADNAQLEQRQQQSPVHSQNSRTMARQVKVVNSPERVEHVTNKSIFLAGTTTKTGEPDWRETLIDALAEHVVTIFNPDRSDWDSTWKEDFSDPRWVEQVQWELDMQEAADIVVVFLHGISAAPISLMELGLCARSGKAIVCAAEGYCKKGNVEAVCRMYKLPFVTTEDDLRKAILQKIS